MQKKFFAWILAAALLLNMPAANAKAAEDGFTDIGNHWAIELITKFTDQGLLTGYPDGTFKPNGYLSRAEAVTLLNKFFNITQSGYPNFVDVKPEDWFYFQVGSAHDRNYISGYPDGTFKPNNNITRLQAFIMIYNLLGAPEFNNVSVLNKYKDADLIPTDKSNYRQIVAYMVDNGIINAYPDGSLRVNDFITRAEMLSLLNKVSDMITNSNSLLPEITPMPSVTPDVTVSVTPSPSPAPTTESNNSWAAPLAPGSNWNTTGSGITTMSALTINPSSLAHSGSGFSGGMPGNFGEGMNTNTTPYISSNSNTDMNTTPYISSNPYTDMYTAPDASPNPGIGMYTAPDASLNSGTGMYTAPEASLNAGIGNTVPDASLNAGIGNTVPDASLNPNIGTYTMPQDGSASINTVNPSQNIIPEGLFALTSGKIDTNESSIIISDSKEAYLNEEYTLPSGMKLILLNSTLILKFDLNIASERDLIGSKGSEIIEQGGILNIGSSETVRRHRAQIKPDTYYYDTKRSKWRALK